MEQVVYMEENGYVDQQTAAIITSFNLFNPNVNYFITCQFIGEFTNGGDAATTAKILPFKVDYMFTDRDKTRVVMEILFAVWLLIQILMFIYEAMLKDNDQDLENDTKNPHKLRRWLKATWWNVLHIVTLLLFVVSVVWYVILNIQNSNFKRQIKDISDSRSFIYMETLARKHESWTVCMVLAIVCAVLNIFRFIIFNPHMAVLWLSFETAGADLFWFLVFFMIVLLAFVFSGCFFFGSQMFDFSEFQWAIVTVMKGVFGDLDYDSMFEINRTIAPVYFFIFTVIIVTIMMNMFTGILGNAYDTANDDAPETPPMSETFGKLFDDLKAKLSRDKDELPPSPSKEYLVMLFQRTFSRMTAEQKEDDMKIEELAKMPGFQDMPGEVFMDIWKQLSSVNEPSEPEKRNLGIVDEDEDQQQEVGDEEEDEDEDDDEDDDE